ncbi:MAG: CocE/NonD family hydrolase [Flavobacteriales bacterium]|nr:CocE/NonD family hydrolase [Flavobacteriales bacterium]
MNLARTVLSFAFLSGLYAAEVRSVNGSTPVPSIQRVRVRDGIVLATSVRVPEKGGPSFPVIFLRTPYGKEYEADQRAHYTVQGYVVVVQDCRGTGDSEGRFEPYLHEKQDGYDALDWISEQTWCDGNVGMIGASYSAQVQWLAAASGHPVLKTLIPQVSGTDPFFDVPFDHGILKLSMIEWAYKLTFPGREPPEYIWSKLYTLPVTRIDDEFFGVNVPLWDRWAGMDHPDDWKAARFLDDMRNVDIPALHVSGNWDVEALSTQLNWHRMQAYGHADQHLLFGPWEHTGFLDLLPTTFSGNDYGEASRLDFEAIWLKWFDHWLKGADNGVERDKPVRLFITGLNAWVELDHWPDADFKKSFLHFDLAHEADHFHALEPTPAPGHTSGYTYVPDSVKLNMDPEFSETSLYTRHPDRQDEIALITAAFEEDTVIGGPAYLDLVFEIDQPDVDLFVLLAEMDPAGNLNVLTHPGKVRGMFRDNASLASMRPGVFETTRIDLFPFAHQFKKGNRLAVIVRSDWFPRYIRNTGTGLPIESATRTRSVNVCIASESELVLYGIPLK